MNCCMYIVFMAILYMDLPITITIAGKCLTNSLTFNDRNKCIKTNGQTMIHAVNSNN